MRVFAGHQLGKVVLCSNVGRLNVGNEGLLNPREFFELLVEMAREQKDGILKLMPTVIESPIAKVGDGQDGPNCNANDQ